MHLRPVALTAGLALALCGCASVQYGDPTTGTRLQQMAPVPGKTGIYVCRPGQGPLAVGNSPTVIVDGKPAGNLRPNTFSFVIVEPGAHKVHINRNPGGDSGDVELTSKAGEVVILWVGMTGGGFGVLTIDNFEKKSDGEECVKGSMYVVQPAS